MRCFAQPVSTTASAAPTIARTIAIRTTRNFPSAAETERNRRSGATTQHRINGCADQPLSLLAVRADEREQAVEVEWFLQESVRIDAGRAGGLESGKNDDRDVGNRGVGLLTPTELPAVHDRHH